MTNVISVPYHVTPMEKTTMPEGMAGAYVVCFIGTEEIEVAINTSVAQLKEDGLFPEKVLEPINQMDSSQWELVVGDNWPEQAGGLFSQFEFEAAIAAGDVVYGPIATYVPQDAT